MNMMAKSMKPLSIYQYLFHMYPLNQPGPLKNKRSHLINMESLINSFVSESLSAIGNQKDPTGLFCCHFASWGWKYIQTNTKSGSIFSKVASQYLDTTTFQKDFTLWPFAKVDTIVHQYTG